MAYTTPYGYANNYPLAYQSQPIQQMYQADKTQDPYVKGIEEARSYPLAPGIEATLWDASKTTFYKVTSNGIGRSNTVRVFNYSEEIDPIENQNATISNNDEILKRLSKLEEEINQLAFRQKNKGNNRRDMNVESTIPTSNNT